MCYEVLDKNKTALTDSLWYVYIIVCEETGSLNRLSNIPSQ